MGFDTPMECGVATVAAQVEPSVLVSCDEFDTQQIGVFLVIYSKMHYKDILTLLSKSARFSVWLCVSYIGVAQYLPDKKKKSRHCLCFWPSLKQQSPSDPCVWLMASSERAVLIIYKFWFHRFRVL